jgi:PKD repeat protein
MNLWVRAGPLGGSLLLLSLFLFVPLPGCSCNGVSQHTVEVTILSPADGARFDLGQSVSFQGQASDSIGDLSGHMLAWSSDLDGSLGSGETLTRDDLSLGVHTITLVATNETGDTGSDAISLEIVPESGNLPPVPEILSPNEGAQFDQGSQLVLNGRATDPEDGQLSGSALTWMSDQDGLLGNGELLTLTSLTIGTHVITLAALDGGGLVGRDSVGIEIVPPGQNHLPVVTISSPADGSAFEDGETIPFSGSATDDEDGVIPSQSLEWSSDLDGILGSGLQLDTTLSLGVHTITLSATDTDGGTGQDLISLVVNPAGNQAPVVTILEPADDSSFEQEQMITFRAEAVDPEDGTLTGSALVWSSDLDGEFGQGEQFGSDSLSVGLHRILLVATDSGLASGTTSVNIRITEKVENLPPTAEITEPQDGTSIERGLPVTFVGSGTDPEDGALSGASLSWSSDLDGPFGNGTPLIISSLSEGQHTITLTVFDSMGAFGQDSIQLIITPQQVENLPPTARIIGPTEAMALTTVLLDASASSDEDGTVVRYRFDFGDGSPAQDGPEVTADHIYSIEGPYTVTLTVYDDDGAEAEATHPIRVTPYVRTSEVVEDSRDRLGSFCALGFTQDNRALVAYRNETHPSIRLASQQVDGTFRIETVEGFGLDLGGDAGSNVDLVVDDTGDIHLAYLLADADGTIWLRYASGTGSNWSLVTVDQAGDRGHFNVTLKINPATSKPEILYTGENDDEVRHAVCSGACSLASSWNSTIVYTESRGHTTYSNHAYAGGFAIQADGTRLAVVSGRCYDSDYDPVADLFTMQSTGGSWSPHDTIINMRGVYSYGEDRDASRMVLDRDEEPLVLHEDGVYHRFSAGNWSLSEVESFDISYFDITFDTASDTAYLVNRHGSDIEVIGENAQSYWLYNDLGPQDQAWPEIQLDRTREVRACFARDGNIMLY